MKLPRDKWTEVDTFLLIFLLAGIFVGCALTYGLYRLILLLM